MAERGTWSRVARRVRVPLGFVFAVVYLWLAKPTTWSIVSGAAVAAVGLWIRAVASGYVKKNAELTTTGPYAYTRNPLYLGSIVIAIGFAIAGRNLWIGLLLVLFFVAIYVPVIRSEEQYLRSVFPAFDAYAARVPRFIPRLTPAGHAASFSADLYRKHREYNALIGTVAMLLALILKLFYIH